MALAITGKNVTNFDKRTLKLISPRFLSLVPEQNENELVSDFTSNHCIVSENFCIFNITMGKATALFQP